MDMSASMDFIPYHDSV